MKLSRSFSQFLAVGGFIWIGLVSVRAQEQACGGTFNEFCRREANRFCFVSSETNKEVCGTCLPGYVEWRARCVSEERVDILLFLDTYEPDYVSSLTDDERREVLQDTIRFITNHNAQNPPPTYELGLNAFSADTEDDRNAHLGFVPAPLDMRNITERISQLPPFEGCEEELPESIDWVEQGAVTDVKDQGRCGCSWAVSLTGVIESANAVQNGFLQSLSFQELISCDGRNSGCDGGSLVYGMGYTILDTDGVSGLAEYPFTDIEGTTSLGCDASPTPVVSVKEASYVIDFYDDITPQQRLQNLKAAVAKQPVAIALRAGCPLFSSYQRGILTDDKGCECTDALCADHAVLLVGYDDTTNPPSFKIKNSWGSGWGDDGYIYISQQPKGNFGLFGMLTHGLVPDLTSTLTESSTEETKPKATTDTGPVFDWWIWLLIWVGAAVVLFLVLGCLFSCICPKGPKKPASDDDDDEDSEKGKDEEKEED